MHLYNTRGSKYNLCLEQLEPVQPILLESVFQNIGTSYLSL